jgi:hypothetical protein
MNKKLVDILVINETLINSTDDDDMLFEHKGHLIYKIFPSHF